MALKNTRVRLYKTVRTAHLERAHQLAPAALVYRVRRYDFDDSLAEGLELVEAGAWSAAKLIAGSRIRALEINEPLWREIMPGAVLAVAATAFRRRGTPRPIVVTYIIGNTDPFEGTPTGWSPRALRARVRARIDRALGRYLWNRLDRIVYGTPDARDNYRKILGAPRRAQERLIVSLPARPDDVPTGARPARVVFLGAFVERKGFDLVLDAWPLVCTARPDAQLLIMGKGPLEDRARDLAARDDAVELLVDPSRDTIRARLATCRVLALPSQRTPTWREQVGLPIVEGLEQGCRIVTTTEGGLAPWLAENGHSVIAAPSTSQDVASAIIAQLDAGDDPTVVLDTLPERDGRLEADDWLMKPTLAGIDERSATAAGR